MPSWDKAAGGWAGAGVTMPPAARAAPPAEDDAWRRLCAWFLSVELPAAPYRVGAALVSDPAVSHAHLRARLAEGVTGQVQRSIAYRLARLRELVEGGGRREDGR